MKLIGSEHPGLHYIPNSAQDVVSGEGPYEAKTQEVLFSAACHAENTQRRRYAKYRHHGQSQADDAGV